MCGLPLNLLVVIGANLSPEVLGEIWSGDDDAKGYFPHGGDSVVGDANGRNCQKDFSVVDRFGPEDWREGGRFDLHRGTGCSGSEESRANDSPASGASAAARGAPNGRGGLHSGGGGGLGRRLSVDVDGFPPPEPGDASGSGASRRQGVALSDEMTEDEERQCRIACPGFVIFPRSLAERGLHFDQQSRTDSEPGKVILVMSYDNIAALMVICALSILGAIYLWKICTRKSCGCRLCLNQYRQLHLIGSGGYGSVYLVERLNDGQRFVSKKIMVRNITEVDEYSKEAKELVTLRHRHIVSYEEDFVHVEHGALEPKTYFIIVMEHCPEGDLKEKIEQDFYAFTEEWVRTVFAQLLQAVQYLHSKNVIHRDLKSQNVFLAEDGHVRLGDFGLCRHTRSPALGAATFSHAGTDCYMAPEMLSSSRYGKPADIWSLGCVLYELCSGQFMWELEGILGAMVMTQSHTVQRLVHEHVVPAVGNTVRSFLRRLLSIKPEGRPTATACIRKKLFKRAFPVSREAFGDQLEPGDGTPGDDDGEDAVSPGDRDGADGGVATSAPDDEVCSESSCSSSSSECSSSGDAQASAQRPAGAEARRKAAPPRRRRRGGYRR